MRCPNPKCPMLGANLVKQPYKIKLINGEQIIYSCKYCKTIVRVELYEE